MAYAVSALVFLQLILLCVIIGLPFEQKDDEREEIDECTEQYSVI